MESAGARPEQGPEKPVCRLQRVRCGFPGSGNIRGHCAIFALAHSAPSASRASERFLIRHPIFGYTMILAPSFKPSFDSLKASLKSRFSLLRRTAPPDLLLTTRPSFFTGVSGRAAPSFSAPPANMAHMARSRVAVLAPSLNTDSKTFRRRRRSFLENGNCFTLSFDPAQSMSGIRFHLPLRRLRARVFLPPAVFIFARKPMCFFLFLTFGLYVGSIIVIISKK